MTGQDYLDEATAAIREQKAERAAYLLEAFLANIDPDHSKAKELLELANNMIGRQRTQDYYELMKVPVEFRGAHPEKIQESARSSIESYCSDIDSRIRQNASLFLTGNPGVGKTSAAVLVGLEARKKFHTTRFCTIDQLRDIVRTDVTAIREFKEVPVLILDNLIELADSRDWSFNLDTLIGLLTHRGQHKRLTILTSGLSPTAPTTVRLNTVLSRYFVHLEITGENLSTRYKSSLRDEVFGKRK